MSKLPKVGDYVRMKGRLVSIDQPPAPPPPPPVYVFEDVSASIEIHSLTGVKIDDRETFNEFHGEGTCVATATKEAEALAEGLGPGVVVVVRRVVEHTEMKPLNRENFYDKEYRDFEPVSTYGSYKTVSDKIVWRSDEAER